MVGIGIGIDLAAASPSLRMLDLSLSSHPPTQRDHRFRDHRNRERDFPRPLQRHRVPDISHATPSTMRDRSQRDVQSHFGVHIRSLPARRVE